MAATVTNWSIPGALAVPRSWQELIKHSSEMATTEDVFKEDIWLSDQKMVNDPDQLTDPFEIVPDQHKRQLPNAVQITRYLP